MNGTPTPFTESDLAVFIGMFIVMIIIAGIIGLVIYLFQAIGLYKISKNRGYKKAWLSFIPIANLYIMGAIADHINALINKKTYYKIILLGLNILTIPFSIYYVGVYVKFMGTIMQNPNGDIENFSQFTTMMGSSGILSLLGLATSVITYIVLYRIYADYSKQNATLFLVLSILFSLQPFFLFAIRNKPSASIYYAQATTTTVPTTVSATTTTVPTTVSATTTTVPTTVSTTTTTKPTATRYPYKRRKSATV